MPLFSRISLTFSLTFGIVSAETLLVLPISGETARTSDMGAINRLFRDAVESRYAGVLPPPPPSAVCADRACAQAAALEAGADEVIYSSFYKLGERWIFSATIVRADGTGAFNERLTAASIEDMEAITLRMADVLTTRKSADQAASVDNITAREARHEPDRRRSLYNGGLALGYLFPVGSSYSYVEEEYFSGDAVKHSYDQMVRLTWLNTWEFRNNMALGADMTWSMPYAFGADLNLRYLFGRGDFSPFVGGGVGLHYIKSDEGEYSDDNKRNSGPALNAQGGMLMFRTYDVNVMLRGQYQVVFNSDMDHGPAIDVGVSFRNRDEGGGKSFDDGMGVWGYVAGTLGMLMVIGLLAN